ncbi:MULTISPECIES: TOBE domain-containing protein [Bordetella]|uniref:Molybdenum-dependent transcriptional regulator n=1 Tax=Bordetella genomosp. 6 TaxID=463024 RepID=A0ABX4FI30_9BORD|nr:MULTISPECIES: TOBE domain-containing protein [Bordetella]AOB29215.1 molybdenum-dependent transcriptional regulator [Bordetella bronchiseptica]ARP79133.1 molybdenum-dependent transcriptional regulator [Bordetella genomosp. 6]AZW46526.1 molybdenum-dependent transcriptional regulator [Bordetella bronchiseptica]MBN3269081.1 molybdenum-dependent transcriptional regulator [Bordetella bronchiseptica]OZI81533.1 molybdenum-dependent transcriptional regulator [Bordetella genomosp. 6]
MSAPSLQLDGALWLRSGDQPWGGQHRIDLLAQIEATGSISAAARAAGMSYKGAWDAIDAMNNLAGEPLVLRSTGGRGGGGTRLTDRARRLIATFRALQAEHQRFVQHLAAGGLDAAGDIDIMRRFMLKTSARNRLLGTVEAVHAGAVNDEIVLRIAGGQRIAAVITRASTEELGLAPGTQAIALIKAQAVLLGLPGPGLRLSARNQLPGKVAEVRPGAVNSEIIVELDGGGTLAAIVTEESARDLALAAGMPVCALFDAASVMLGVLD